MGYERTGQHANNIHRQHDDWDEVHNQLLAIQKKSLQVSDPNDTDEKEADEVARKVVDGQSAEIHGTGGTINRKGEGSAETSPEFQSKLESSKSGGQSLPENVQQELGSKMGADFSSVKIHTGSEANHMNESINAKAFTHGSDIYFKNGNYNSESSEGKELLAHELVHTQQQSNGKVQPKIQRSVEDYVPDWAEYQTKMAALDDAGRKSAIETYQATVKSSWDLVDVLGYLDLLADTETEKNLMPSTPPIEGIPGSKPSNYNYLFNIKSPSTSIGYSLIKGEPVLLDDQKTTKQYSVEDLSKSATDTTAAVKSLRMLDDVLKRVLIADKVSKDTGMPISRVLAVYRREGNLNVPPTISEYNAGIPSGTSNAPTSMSSGWMLSHNAIIADAAALDAAASSSGTSVQSYMISAAAVQIAGLDQMGSWMLADAKKAGISYEAQFAIWSNKNWIGAGRKDDKPADATARFKKIKDLTNLDKVGTPPVYRLVPTDTVGFVSAILIESMMLNKRYEDVSISLGTLPDNYTMPTFSKEMAYLAYQSGIGNFHSILVSAANSAKKTSNAVFSNLKAALTDAKNGWKGPGWTSLQTWLVADGQRLQMLSEFVQTASLTDWPDWAASRAKFGWINTLDQFYGNVLDPEKGKWLKGHKKLLSLFAAETSNSYDETGVNNLMAKWKKENVELTDFTISAVKKALGWQITAVYQKWSDDALPLLNIKN